MVHNIIKLKDDIVIKGIYTLYYFERSKNFYYDGEKHDFWEMVYVDKGEGVVTADDREFVLKQGSVVFHKPDEFHALRSNNEVAPNFLIVTFECGSKAMKNLENKVVTLGETQKSILSKIIDERTKVFSNPLHELISADKKCREIPFGAEQLIKLYLTEFLISIIRKDESKTRKVLEYHTEDNIFNIITDFMNNNIANNLNFNDIVKYSNLSGSSLKRLFKKNCGIGVMDYYINLKIDYAKKYIRENEYNMSQIASMLGYDSIHYFSNQFKTRTGMSPTEYKKTII
ncbi:MAG: AraC family transcriptional regulator [Clostridia bacterium]|nr:AraC family transcriptional regulator [Clostridia bacterium]